MHNAYNPIVARSHRRCARLLIRCHHPKPLHNNLTIMELMTMGVLLIEPFPSFIYIKWVWQFLMCQFICIPLLQTNQTYQQQAYIWNNGFHESIQQLKNFTLQLMCHTYVDHNGVVFDPSNTLTLSSSNSSLSSKVRNVSSQIYINGNLKNLANGIISFDFLLHAILFILFVFILWFLPFRPRPPIPLHVFLFSFSPFASSSSHHLFHCFN